MVATAGQNSVCGLHCHRLCVGHEKSNLIKKHGEWRTKTYIKTWSFLTVLFVLPSSRNEREWVAAMVAQKMVFGLHSHRSGVRIKSSNLIEKMVSKTLWPFLTVLFALPLCCNEREWVAATAGQKKVCGLHCHRSGVRIKSSNFIEKMVSKSTVTPSKLYVFSPVFLLSHSVVTNACGWQQQRGKRRSVGFNTPDCACELKAAISFKKWWVKQL